VDCFSSAVADRGTESQLLPALEANDLEPGEQSAIALADAKQPDVLLLIDEDRGRQEAARRGIATTGTLGVLDAAAATRLLDLEVAFQRLQATNFYVNNRILRRLLERDAQRKKVLN